MTVVLMSGFKSAHAKSAKAKNNSPVSLGKYGDWHAFEVQEDGHKVCYMVSPAKKSSGKYSKRGDVYMVVAHRPSLKSYDVVSHHAGYPLKPGEDVKLEIKTKGGDKKEVLFSEGEVAWCLDDKTDRLVTESLTKKGSQVTIHGQSTRGTKTTDIYSLKGSLQAYKAICKACDVKR